MRHVHSDRIERWLGAEQAAHLSRQMEQWYGPPIPVSGVPGCVYAARGGDFVGSLKGGQFACAADAAWERIKRRMRMASRVEHGRLNAIATYADLLQAARTRTQSLAFNKPGAGSTGQSCSFWILGNPGNYPAAGGAPAAAPGGTVHTSATGGAMAFANPTTGQTYFIGGTSKMTTTTPGCASLLLYDKLWGVSKAASSTATEAVSGAPTRYTSTTPGAVDSAEGNFLYVAATASMGATAHNWTVCTYTDQAGNTGATLPAVTGIVATSTGVVDMQSLWFAPLATGDTGIKALTQMQNSASVTGVPEFAIGHPIGWLPILGSQGDWFTDAILGGFQFSRVFDDACLAIMAVLGPQSITTTFSGQIDLIQG